MRRNVEPGQGNRREHTRPRVGVYVCHCGTNIAGVVDVEQVAGHAARLENVTVARHYAYMCSDPGQALIKRDIEEHQLDRVVVASCSPLMHETTFQDACREAGLNPFLFQMTNIREHVAWVHDDTATATAKAVDLVTGAVRRVQHHHPLETRRTNVRQAALVVGAGIAGIEAALRLADAGKHVYLVEREPGIGGHMAQLYKTFPTLDCAAWILTPMMVSVGRHKNISLLTYSEVEELSGYVGHFKARVRRKARYVDEEDCTGCGTCVEKCPWKKIPSTFDLGLGTRPAIYFHFSQAVPRIPVIDRENCSYFKKGKCKACAKFCPRDAIDFEQEDQLLDLEVGTVILATGFQDFDPARSPQYGYGQLDNVLTGMEFERLVNSGGPTAGKVRLADGSKPERIAIIHCVGSRGDQNEHCSRVCCMYSLKLAHLARDLLDVEVVEFYRDMRTFGKEYESFYERIQREGVEMIRYGEELAVSRANGRLHVYTTDLYTGLPRVLAADMVVLSTGLEPQADQGEVARIFGLSLSPDGFFLEKHPKLAPVETATDGVFLAGACQSPKDIPDSVAHAGAAAAAALALMDAGSVTLQPYTARIDPERCSGCFTCTGLCPYGAIEITAVNGRSVAQVNEVLCKGCGACVAACPSGIATQLGFTAEQVSAEISGALLRSRQLVEVA